MLKYDSDRENWDRNIYDTCEGEMYERGFCMAVIIDCTERKLIDLRRVVEMSNPIAYIPTNQHFECDKANGIAYLIFNSKFELGVGLRNARELFIEASFLHGDNSDDVWYDRRWQRSEYDPTILASDADRYRFVCNKFSIRNFISKEELFRYKRAYNKENCKFYAPKSDTDDNCKNKGSKNDKICFSCAASDSGHRYGFSNGTIRRIYTE